MKVRVCGDIEKMARVGVDPRHAGTAGALPRECQTADVQ